MHTIAAMNDTLLSKTLRLLETTQIPVAVIASECDVSVRWIYRLRAGDYDDPGVNRIERIHAFLNRKPRRLNSEAA